jgi:hypothetical protein
MNPESFYLATQLPISLLQQRFISEWWRKHSWNTYGKTKSLIQTENNWKKVTQLDLFSWLLDILPPTYSCELQEDFLCKRLSTVSTVQHDRNDPFQK